MYQLIADGALPLPETTHYPLADAATAIRVMGAAEHTGKLVLDVPRTGHSSVVVPPEQAQVFRRDGAYIITGGLGGLGLFLAAEDGRGGLRPDRAQRPLGSPTRAAQKAIERIRATGADIEVECGDIAEPETADRVVAAATATGLPLRGVLHAAAVVEDATLANITDELIDRDWAPKVYGAWNLHHATAGQPLDWFCSFSSAAALVGSPGQGAYAAANSWLDAFTHWRRAQGLPATAIAWGAWAEIGRGHGTCGRRPRLRDQSRRRCLRVRGAAASRPRLHRLCADHGSTVADGLRATQPVRRGVQVPPGKAERTQASCAPSWTRCRPTSGPPGCAVWSPIRSA